MAYMAGTYAEYKWHGILREHHAPVSHCIHNHRSREEARKCADKAKISVKETNTLPVDWINFREDNF